MRQTVVSLCSSTSQAASCSPTDLLTKAVARPLYLALLRIFDDYAVTGIVYPTDESKITVKDDTPNDVEVPA